MTRTIVVLKAEVSNSNGEKEVGARKREEWHFKKQWNASGHQMEPVLLKQIRKGKKNLLAPGQRERKWGGYNGSVLIVKPLLHKQLINESFYFKMKYIVFKKVTFLHFDTCKLRSCRLFIINVKWNFWSFSRS